jgi:hypothetical protein
MVMNYMPYPLTEGFFGTFEDMMLYELFSRPVEVNFSSEQKENIKKISEDYASDMKKFNDLKNKF